MQHFRVLFEHSPVFSHSNLDRTHWSFVELGNIQFEGPLTLYEAIFTNCALYETIFGKNTQLDRITFTSTASCVHCRFVRSSLRGARLAHSTFLQSTFSSLPMTDSDLRNGSFNGSRFERVLLDRANLSGAHLQRCQFDDVSMVNCSMFAAILEKANFTKVNLTGCRGLTDAQLFSNVLLYQTILPNGTLIQKSLPQSQ